MTYTQLNTSLVEKFGEVEKICNQSYNVNHGVTAYIDDMKINAGKGRMNVFDWDIVLKRLIDVRHKRNKLSHGEVPFDTPYATFEDIEFVVDFKRRLLAGSDPLAVNYRAETGIKRKDAEMTVIRKRALPVETYWNSEQNYTPNRREKKTNLALIAVIIYFIVFIILFGMFKAIYVILGL